MRSLYEIVIGQIGRSARTFSVVCGLIFFAAIIQFGVEIGCNMAYAFSLVWPLVFILAYSLTLVWANSFQFGVQFQFGVSIGFPFFAKTFDD